MKITRVHLDRFLERHATAARTLDIGAGGSSYARFFPNRVALDIDPLRKPDIVGDAHALPFGNASFSVVLCTEVLEHLRDPRKAFAEMARVVEPGGRLILTTRFVYPLHDTPSDFWRFTKYGLRELCGTAWEIEELVPEVATFSTIGVLLQRIGFQSHVRGGKMLKLSLYGLAYLCTCLDWLIVREFGNIQRTAPESQILTSGYYLVARRTTRSPVE